MKKILLTLIAACTIAVFGFGQARGPVGHNFVYVDSDHILNSIPEYQRAQKELDDISNGWKGEIDKRYKEIDELYRAYQSEQVILPEATKVQKQKEIEDKEKAVKEYQKQKFGYEGELFKKKQELIKPIQDKIYNEIQKQSTDNNWDIVFDKSGGLTMLFTNTKLDKSDDIIAALGFKPVKPKDGDKKDADKKTPEKKTTAPTEKAPEKKVPEKKTPENKTTGPTTTPEKKP